jgi:hypothetical protein
VGVLGRGVVVVGATELMMEDRKPWLFFYGFLEVVEERKGGVSVT